ncbi:MAG: FIST C-terminal domain-containing protein [Betaproteobacteria bacterium]|nr:FIST C-terminal domain-containing protein [Betaproteobacteria bacterium]
MLAASALIHAPRAEAELAARAVEEASRRAGLTRPARVLLFLTPQMLPCAAAAVKAAARAAQCLQVTGCVAPGIFSESEWVLDAPAAAALVLSDAFVPKSGSTDQACTLTLLAPDMFRPDWLGPETRHFGALVGEAQLRAAYPLWSAGRIQTTRWVSETLGGQAEILVAPGITPFTPLWRVTEAQNGEIASCDHRPLWRNLLRLIPHERVKNGAFSLQRLFACISEEEPEVALANGQYEMIAVLGTNSVADTVTLARRVEPGTRLFWAIREPQGAEAELRHKLQALPEALAPAFGLMVSCIGRGAGFYGGHDRDWQLVRERFPGLPLLGIYGSGEVVPGGTGARLLHYAAALALFTPSAPHV